MDAAPPKSPSLFLPMLLFEGSLGLGAVIVSGLVGHNIWVGMRWTPDTLSTQFAAIGWGLVATIPMIVVLGLMYVRPIGPLKALRRLTRRYLIPLFSQLTLAEKAAVALAAGLGEELLFRGLIQGGLAEMIGGENGLVIAIVVASLIFGACHWLTNTYAALAAMMGVYFGGLLVMTGNLWTPIIAHATYDFVALVYLTWGRHPQVISLQDASPGSGSGDE